MASFDMRVRQQLNPKFTLPQLVILQMSLRCHNG